MIGVLPLHIKGEYSNECVLMINDFTWWMNRIDEWIKVLEIFHMHEEHKELGLVTVFLYILVEFL